MKKILYAILVLLFISCKKEDKSDVVGNLNNQFIATVFHLRDSSKINSYGSYTSFYKCVHYTKGLYGFIDTTEKIYPGASGTNLNSFNGEQVGFEIKNADTSDHCLRNTGTYPIFACAYVPNSNTDNHLIYTGEGVYNKGSVTITKLDEKYVEGYFNAVCKNTRNPSDSVFVKGTFKHVL